MLVPDEPLVLTAFAALGRALFRYRSELAPFTTAAALAATALAMHLTNPHLSGRG